MNGCERGPVWIIPGAELSDQTLRERSYGCERAAKSSKRFVKRVSPCVFLPGRTADVAQGQHITRHTALLVDKRRHARLQNGTADRMQREALRRGGFWVQAVPEVRHLLLVHEVEETQAQKWPPTQQLLRRPVSQRDASLQGDDEYPLVELVEDGGELAAFQMEVTRRPRDLGFQSEPRPAQAIGHPIELLGDRLKLVPGLDAVTMSCVDRGHQLGATLDFLQRSDEGASDGVRDEAEIGHHGGEADRHRQDERTDVFEDTTAIQRHQDSPRHQRRQEKENENANDELTLEIPAPHGSPPGFLRSRKAWRCRPRLRAPAP